MRRYCRNRSCLDAIIVAAFISARASLALSRAIAAGPRRRAAADRRARYGHTVAVPSAMAVHRDGPVVLDAKLDEAAWAAATPITEFRQIDPDEGKPASQRTEVRFLYDDDALYVGAKMYDTRGRGGRQDAARAARRELRLRLLRDRDRRLSRSSEPRVLRRESVRLEGRPHRHRHVVLRQLLGSGLGGGDAHRRRRVDGGDPHSVQPTPLLARLGADVGARRCAASSSAATNRISGRAGARPRRAARRGSAISRGCAFRTSTLAPRAACRMR